MRQQLWFPNANLAGHSLTALGLVFLSIAGTLMAALWGFVLMLLAILLTGSRTALAVAFIAGFILIGFQFKNKHRRRHFGLLILSLVTLLLVFVSLESNLFSIRALSGEQVISRPTIWQGAWSAFMDYPVTGLPKQDFQSYFRTHYPQASLVSHAHNFWLDFAAKHGIFGLIASLYLSFFVTLFAWQQGKVLGLILISAIWTLQIFDVSFLHSGVLLSLIFGFNLLSQKLSVSDTKQTQTALRKGWQSSNYESLPKSTD